MSFFEFFAYAAQIFTAIGIFLAYLSYDHQRRTDDAKFIMEQVGFYRKEIITLYDSLAKEILSFDKTYTSKDGFPRPSAPLEELSIKYWYDNFPEIANKQKNLVLNEIKQRQISDRRVESGQISLLNSLEDFALKVVYCGTANHPALNSIKTGFIQLVEENLSTMFRLELIQGAPYLGIKNLYKQWKNEADHRNTAERVRMFGEN